GGPPGRGVGGVLGDGGRAGVAGQRQRRAGGAGVGCGDRWAGPDHGRAPGRGVGGVGGWGGGAGVGGGGGEGGVGGCGGGWGRWGLVGWAGGWRGGRAGCGGCGR